MNPIYRHLQHSWLIRLLRRFKYLLVSVKPVLLEIDDHTSAHMALQKAFDIYGYIKLESFFNKTQVNTLIQEYDSVIFQRTGIALSSTDKVPGILMNELNNLPSFPEMIRNSPLISLLSGVFGKDFRITGSDLTVFRNGTSLHRDSFSEFSMPKIGLYLSSSSRLHGGQMMFVPGSHKKGTSFGLNCSFGLRWPSGGGYNLQSLGNVLIKKLGRYYLSIDSPVAKVDIRAGDLIIFDNRLVHGTVHRTNKLRRMIAINLIEGWNESMGISPEAHKESLLDFRGASDAVEEIRNGRKINDPFLDMKNYEFFHSFLFNDSEKVRQKYHFEKYKRDISAALERVSSKNSR